MLVILFIAQFYKVQNMKIKLNKLVSYQIFNLVKFNEKLIDKSIVPFKLRRSEWKIIMRFNFLNSPMTQSQLSDSVGIDCAHLTRLLGKLEKRKLLYKRCNINDKRKFDIFPTKKCVSLLAKIEKIMEEHERKLLKNLNHSETIFFKKIIKKITNNITQKQPN